MRISTVALSPPTIDFGGKAEKDCACGPESDLWVAQQAMLALHRERLCVLAGQPREGSRSEGELRNTFDLLAGQMHVAAWPTLLPVFDAVDSLGSKYHRGFIVLGGWHHQGDVSKLTPPPSTLLSQLRDYRQVTHASSLLTALNHAPSGGAAEGMVNLAMHLKRWPALFDGDAWKRPEDLGTALARKEEQLRLGIETLFLFLQERIFAFCPTAKCATSGWCEWRRESSEKAAV